MRKSTPLVNSRDRNLAAILVAERIHAAMRHRTGQRTAALLDEPEFAHHFGSDGSIRSDCAELFPGRRSAWVR